MSMCGDYCMDSIQDLVDTLVAHPAVVGLIEYGSARHEDEKVLGDYDLVAVLTERDPKVESIHFYVAKIPVDLSLRTLDDIRAITRVVGFDAVLLDGRIIHDPSGGVSREIQALRKRHQECRAPSLSPVSFSQTCERIGGGGRVRHYTPFRLRPLPRGVFGRALGTAFA